MSGRFRMRYAANRSAVAARERFPARVLTEAEGDLWVVRLAISGPVLALTRQSNLDALGVDDRVSTGRIHPFGRSDPDPLLDTCGQLADALYDWWHGYPPPLLYRARTAPGTGRSVAFTPTSPWSILAARPLREARGLHAHLTLRAGFVVPSAWLR
ncbi:MAG: hypothetical protein ACYC1D_00810 [Acidimicrobiales bacterium]